MFWISVQKFAYEPCRIHAFFLKKNLDYIDFITSLSPGRDLTSTAVRRFHEEVPIQAHHCNHFPHSCSMHVCTGDFRIWGLGSFLKMYTSLLWKYTLDQLFLGPLLILLLKCNNRVTMWDSVSACRHWKIKACFCVLSETRPLSLWHLAFLVLLLSLCPFIGHITPR